MTNLSKFDFNRLTTLTLLALLPAPVIGQTLDEIVVIGTTPLAGSGQELRKIPFNAQTVSADDLSRSLSLDITDQLNANLLSDLPVYSSSPIQLTGISQSSAENGANPSARSQKHNPRATR